MLTKVWVCVEKWIDNLEIISYSVLFCRVYPATSVLNWVLAAPASRPGLNTQVEMLEAPIHQPSPADASCKISGTFFHPVYSHILLSGTLHILSSGIFAHSFIRYIRTFFHPVHCIFFHPVHCIFFHPVYSHILSSSTLAYSLIRYIRIFFHPVYSHILSSSTLHIRSSGIFAHSFIR